MVVMQPVAASMLPSRCMKCMALAKGFADRSVSIDEVATGKKKARVNKKQSRREHISDELQQLKAADVQIPSRRAPPASVGKGNGNKSKSASPSQQQQSPEQVASLARNLQEEVLRLQQDVRNSEFYRNFLAVFRGLEEPAHLPDSEGDSSRSGPTLDRDRWQWNSVTQMVLYGLGSPGKSAAARYQLGFALLLAELLPGLAAPLDAFDPAFDDVDRALLSNLGVTVHGADERCSRLAQGPTLFYMPHCITAGFENLLRANTSCLDRVAILGNSFLGYRVSWKIGRSEREEIQEILQLMEEGRVMENAISESDMENVSDRAFYRQSLHLFKRPS